MGSQQATAQRTPNRLQRGFSAVKRRALGTIVSVQTSEPLAALTFDDGPHPDDTPRLLAILARHGAHATFFMVGRQAAAHPDIVAQVAAAGHAIGNHTFDHVRMPQTPRRERLRQLSACRRAIGPACSPLFRPPFGGQTLGSRVDALALGYAVVAWSMHAEDWAGLSSNTMLERLERQLRPGSIALLHDMIHTPRVAGAEQRDATFDAVDRLLARMGDRYTFVTIPELLRRGRPVRAPWFKPAQ